jgi:hypothetical protein
LHLTDGGDGDDDGDDNGVIVDPGGPAVTTAQEVTETLVVSADTYLRSGGDNTNEGAASFLRVQASGNNRALVAIDEAALEDLVGDGEVLSAHLELDIVENAENWGTDGRTVDAHRLTSAWVEGNGFVAEHRPSDRGTGAGATWECAIDGDVANHRQDCDGPTAWEMGKNNEPELHPWDPDATDTVLITKGLLGTVSFDVTNDVADFLDGAEPNHGWIIKKTDEGANGKV